jgi:hypothetical protein
MTTEENGPNGGGEGPVRRRRRWWLVAATGLVVVGVAAVVAYAYFRESTTPVDVADAVDDFRREESTVRAPETTVATTVGPATTAAATSTSAAPATTAATTTTSVLPPPGSGLPEPGVYTYATSGGESIDALGGRRHEYPDVSTITVTHRGCGASLRWRPLRERWDDTTLCPSPRGMELRRERNHHEFFNIADDRDFVCEAGSLFFPAPAEPGDTWTATCSTGEIAVVRTGTIVGTRQVDVGGTPVRVLEFEVDDAISGASTGTTQRTVSVVPETGLIVELDLTTDVRNDSPIGDVHYQESYQLRLTSLEPRR